MIKMKSKGMSVPWPVICAGAYDPFTIRGVSGGPKVPRFRLMRTTTIIATIATAILMGSAAASSLNVHPARAEVCSTPAASTISLVGSQGAFGVVLISAPVCVR